MTPTNAPRILCVIDSLSRSGAEQSLVTMAPHLVTSGLDIEVAYLNEGPGLRQVLEAAQIVVHSLSGPVSRLGRVRLLQELVEHRQPALIHTTLFESDIAGRLAARRTGVPCVSSLVSVPYGPEQARDPSLRRWKLFAAHLADQLTARIPVRFHAITEHVATRMSANLHIPRESIMVIPRGRDRAVLGMPSSERRRSTRASLRLDEHHVVLLAAARQEYVKGLDVLIDAMPQIRASVPNVKLLIAGRQGQVTDALTSKINEHGLLETVEILGMRDDVPDLLCAADVFVFPSRWEGLGGAVLEAMALNVPVVASDLPAVREVGCDNVTYFNVADAQALYSAVVRVLQDPATSARTSAARNRFDSLYTIERVVSMMADFYTSAIDANLTCPKRRSRFSVG